MSIRYLIEAARAAALAMPEKGREHREPVLAATAKADEALCAYMRSAYPDLCRWVIQAPGHYCFAGDRRGWVAWRNNEIFRRAVLSWCDRVIPVAAGRIAEVYGLGAGDALAALTGQQADESRARSQVLASLASVAGQRGAHV